MKKLYTLLFAALVTSASYSQVVISQAYGGGGNAGSTYTHDFVELFNRGTTPVNIGGYSLQYASQAGSNWSKTVLPSFNLLPGQYYLVQQAQGSGGTTALPSPDFVTTVDVDQIAMSGTNFKLLLANSDVTVSAVPNPTDSQIIDFLGVGGANYAEGTAAPVLSNTTAALRNADGCTDTNNNAADFTVVAPAPRNSTTALDPCTLAVDKNAIAGLSVYPNPVVNGNLFITSDSGATKLVIIYDVLGKQVVKANVTSQPVNVSNLNGGVYIVKITEEGKTATRKLVIK